MSVDTLRNENAVLDSAVVEAANAEPQQINLAVRSDSLPSIILKGDTFEYRVNVSWTSPTSESAVLVLPMSSANTKGVTQIGLREEHSRVVQSEKTISNTQFVYTLVADDTGTVTIPALHFQAPTSNGPFEFESEMVSFRIEEPSYKGVFAILGAVLLFLLIVATVAVQKRKVRQKARKKAAKAEDALFVEEFLLLKKRIAKADSRAWLLELEKICKSWVLKRFGSDNLEALAKDGKLEGWDSLLEEFAHARYGGGDRDAFKNKETWKIAAKLLNIEEDD